MKLLLTQDVRAQIKAHLSDPYRYADGSPLLFDNRLTHVLIGRYWFAWASVVRCHDGVQKSVRIEHGSFNRNGETWHQ